MSQAYSFGYNGSNQLESFIGPEGIITTYEYNGNGLRSSKTTGDETTGFYYHNGSIVLETGTDNQTLATNTRGLQLISRETEADTIYYLHNTRGDIVKLTDQTGSIIKDYTYDPFGNGKEAEFNNFGINGFDPQAATVIDNPFRYSGEYFDSETGNYYLRARYYDPQIQRFITEDSYKGEANNPFSLNGYSYCWNDPVNNVDPSGHHMRDIDGGALSGTEIEYYEALTDYNSEEPARQVLYSWLATNPKERISVLKMPHSGFYIDSFLSKLMYEDNENIDVTKYSASELDKSYELEHYDRIGMVTTGVDVAGGMLVKQSLKSVANVAQGMSKTEYARYMGKLGEEAAGITGTKIRIPSMTGKASYRIPDELLPAAGILREIKNVKYQGLTSQIKDLYFYSKEMGYKFILETRSDTRISKPLQELIDNGDIIHKIIGQ